MSTAENTAYFNHRYLRFVESCGAAAAKAEAASLAPPPVLRVAHSKHFVVRFCDTDNRRFKYTISAIKEPEGEPSTSFATTAAVATKLSDLGPHQVPMRHSRLFQRYHVAVTPVAPEQMPREQAERRFGLTFAKPSGDAPFQVKSVRPSQSLEVLLDPQTVIEKEETVELRGVEFDLHVDSKAEWDLTFSGGIAFSNVVSDRFYLKKDDKGTPEPGDDTSTVEQDPDAPDGFRPDIIALANLQFPFEHRGRGWGLAFGFGIGDNSQPRYFFGPSFTLGQKFILTGGWTGGQVDDLPIGQELRKPPISGDTTLANLNKPFRHGVFLGLAFTFVNRADAFGAQLEPKTESAPKATEKPADPEAAKPKVPEGKSDGTSPTPPK